MTLPSVRRASDEVGSHSTASQVVTANCDDDRQSLNFFVGNRRKQKFRKYTHRCWEEEAGNFFHVSLRCYSPCFVSDIAIFVLKRDVKLQLTHTVPVENARYKQACVRKRT